VALLFDVTETQGLNRITILREKFRELENTEFRLQFDNFGPGNSSFAVFRYFALLGDQDRPVIRARPCRQQRQCNDLQEHDPDSSKFWTQCGCCRHRDQRRRPGVDGTGLRHRAKISIWQINDGPTAHDHGHGRPSRVQEFLHSNTWGRFSPNQLIRSGLSPDSPARHRAGQGDSRRSC
jgi:hypothetical protein